MLELPRALVLRPWFGKQLYVDGARAAFEDGVLVGEKVRTSVAHGCAVHLAKIRSASEEERRTIAGIGPETARTIAEFFRE